MGTLTSYLEAIIEFYSESIVTDKLVDYTLFPEVTFDKKGDAKVDAILNIDPGGRVEHSFALKKVDGKWWVFVAR